MSPWVAHFANGNAFLAGAVLVLAACLAAFGQAPLASPRVRRWLLLIGVILIALSTTPLPYWLYAVWLVLLIGWVVADRFAKSSAGRRVSSAAAAGVVVLSGIALVWEASTLHPRSQPPAHGETVYVIGDSVSAGMNEPITETWPAVMSHRYEANVVNLAEPGATTKSAIEQAAGIEAEACVVVIEIGGNDLLSGLPAGEFRQQLRSLLATVCRPGRRVLMMELPLPPTYVAYGFAQRELAAEFKVGLISKREFVRVLSTSDATVDGVHLSPAGHSLMADRMWQYIEPVLPATVASD